VVAAGLSAAALTDHDTTAGHPEFAAVLAHHGIEFIPGVEISCRHEPAKVSAHVLCYFVDDAIDSPLQATIASLRDDRATRNHRLLELLHSLGYREISQEQIETIAEKPLLEAGRPHFSQAILEHYGTDSTFAVGPSLPTHFESSNDVFARLLGNDKPGYIPKAHLSIADAARDATASSAVAVIAHPLISFCSDKETNWTVEKQRAHLDPLFAGFAADGVVGIETYYSRHSPEEVAMLLDLCSKYDFVPTGGSDFHGSNKKDLSVGVGVTANKGTASELRVPNNTVAALRSRRKI
jgi:predicted metal-dependent phosphoesterase TrpH